MGKMKFYRNLGDSKVLDFGIKINDELVYTKDSGEYTIYHIQTGTRVCSNKKLKDAKEKAVTLFVQNRELVEMKTKEIDINTLPVKMRMYSIEKEIKEIIKLKDIPVDPVIYEIEGRMTVDFVELDKVISKKKLYNEDLSLNDNIVNMFGKRMIGLLNNLDLAIIE